MSEIDGKLPKYCNFNKFLLVEELALETDFSRLHYGRCTVIGRLFVDPDDGRIYLGNVELRHLESEYRLPDCCVRIRLLTLDCQGDRLIAGNWCQLLGEVVLVNLNNPAANHIPLTSRGVNERLLSKDEREQKHFLEQLRESHRPAIKVWLLKTINRPDDLAQRNLEIRMLCQNL